MKSVRIPETDSKTKRFGYMELPDADSLIRCLEYDGEVGIGQFFSDYLT